MSITNYSTSWVPPLAAQGFPRWAEAPAHMRRWVCFSHSPRGSCQPWDAEQSIFIEAQGTASAHSSGSAAAASSGSRGGKPSPAPANDGILKVIYFFPDVPRGWIYLFTEFSSLQPMCFVNPCTLCGLCGERGLWLGTRVGPGQSPHEGMGTPPCPKLLWGWRKRLSWGSL